ncbi:MAG TPA: carboxypeptidase-like regulatory domain-containing protein [Candidatus Baltobacteraceae bacterium]|nr:carboxypeptidase-like regulatory domain-containing protein [Candidatus Baltobacteraceae bacterium]
MKRARLILGAVFALVALAGCNDSALPPGGTYQSVSGVVVDSANKPIAGATVTVDTVLTQVTDSAGKFSFAKVPVGEVDYVVTPPANSSYKQTPSQTAHLLPDKPLTLTVTLSQ